ncbi:MAG: hypothetical protein ACREQI_14755 [Candidatus Binataceae bacterium]
MSSLECPDCHNEALQPGDVVRCSACGYANLPEKAATDYATNVLRVSQRDVIKYGATWPVRNCPDCDDDECLIDLGADLAGSRYICLHCGESFGKLDHCGECDLLFRPNERLVGIHDACFSEKIARND